MPYVQREVFYYKILRNLENGFSIFSTPVDDAISGASVRFSNTNPCLLQERADSERQMLD